MITKIIAKGPCFPEGGVEFNPKKINFIYGSNGSGKTTLSRSIYNNHGLTWAGDTVLEALVYNRDFIKRNFNTHSAIKGIFTLGIADDEIQNKIKACEDVIDDIEERKLPLYNNELMVASAKKDEDEKALNNNAWGKIKKYPELSGILNYNKKNVKLFGEIFIGKYSAFYEKYLEVKQIFLNEKNKFFSYKKEELDALISSSLLTFTKINYYEKPKTEDSLLKRKQMLFNEGITELPEFSNIDLSNLDDIENDDILKEVIIGKKDVSISAMIEKLENSDWVRQGKKYLDNSENICPFCQEKTSLDFRKALESYFDDSFSSKIDLLEEFKVKYENFYKETINKLNEENIASNKYLMKSNFAEDVLLLKKVFEINIKKIENKISKPASIESLESISPYMKKIKQKLSAAIFETEKHNDICRNLVLEQNKLKEDVWQFFVEDTGFDNIKKYLENINNAEKIISETVAKIEEEKKKKAEAANKKNTLLASITGIAKTIEKINKNLLNFGFLNFKLAEAETPGYYKLIRENGENVEDTLSEGEKTLICFLYFYNLIDGSHNDDGVTKPKIIVFDDPISSLDNQVLFIVSTLIRNKIFELKSGKNGDKATEIKQIFVLTHNIFFFKEVSYNIKKSIIHFATLHKISNKTKLTESAENPIKSSYELLWKQLADGCREVSQDPAVCNVMRRILETYFIHFGGQNSLDSILKDFDESEKPICASLIKWAHAGSHNIDDDWDLSLGFENIQKYKKIFKKIFTLLHHDAHYKMMMDKYDSLEINSSDVS